MNRKKFLKTIVALPLAATGIMNLRELDKITTSFDNTSKMPILFIGHGSPMNAIEENEFVKGWRTVGKSLPKPSAILCVSAHWETKGTLVTAMDRPRTIHDFGGFPKELFEVQYPAPGSPKFAKETQSIITKTQVRLDTKWGLDHGSWSVVRPMFPAATIPVFQLSLDYTKDAQYHYDLAKQLSSLRNKGVLIIGSGNIIHNLGMVAWDKLNAVDYAYDWAREAKSKLNHFILNGDHKSLIHYKSQGKEINLSIPTPEHYLPLLYILALKEPKERIQLFNDKSLAGSLSMTSLKINNT
jgi:4,5-DOPA dioxygenase extradiol